jgi:hypothetical protein
MGDLGVRKVGCGGDRLAVVVIVRAWTWVTAGGWMQVGGFGRTDGVV